MNDPQADLPTITVRDLKPGDVLLHQAVSQKLHQRRISKATGSPYTHASIYLGDDTIAEAVPVRGVRKVALSTQIISDHFVGVLRTQMGFSQERARKLNRFVSALEEQASYDWKGIGRFERESRKYLEDQLGEIERRFGSSEDEAQLIGQSYFCSALVVACFYVTGIIDETAQVAYPHKLVSPGDLHRDPTFGWFLGYIVSPGAEVPADDPLRMATSWADVAD